MAATAIYWFRRDLRLSDNTALASALRSGEGVLPVYVMPDEPGQGESAWLARSLASLDAGLRAHGSRLLVRHGPADEVLAELVSESGARTVHCTRLWTPAGLAEEHAVADVLAPQRVGLIVAEGSLLVTPDAISTGTGDPYRVFTPYFRTWEGAWDGGALPAGPPERIPAPGSRIASEALPEIPAGLPDPTVWWTPGETGAQERLAEFVDDALEHYDEQRDLPALDATSRLSPHLAFGEVSPRQVAAAVTASGLPREATRPFLRQLAWREFAAHVLHHNPRTLTEPLRPEFARMPWSDDPDAFTAWREGRTGYPLVDAGMRQLAATGWMHNRVRLVAASFLTKHLLVPWQTGERYFADALIDFDVASNVFNWQWVAGCGADAAPYFRIFNPWLQATRFDAGGQYVRHWVPEVDSDEYPSPIIDHAEARERALAAYAAIKG